MNVPLNDRGSVLFEYDFFPLFPHFYAIFIAMLCLFLLQGGSKIGKQSRFFMIILNSVASFCLIELQHAVSQTEDVDRRTADEQKKKGHMQHHSICEKCDAKKHTLRTVFGGRKIKPEKPPTATILLLTM